MNFQSLSKTIAVAGAVCAVLLTTACGGNGSLSGSSNGSDGGDTLKLAMLGDIATPDPDTAYDGAELNVVDSAYEGLLTYEPGDSEAKIVGDLATDWTSSEDNTMYTFTLREDVTFHDGERFTSAAVKPSFDRRLAVDKGPAYMVSGVKSVQTDGDYKVSITLDAPNSAFLDYLASPFGPKMISPKALDEHSTNNGTDWFNAHDAGTGPYEYDTFNDGQSYALKAYDGYWGDKPGYQAVEFTVFSNLATVQLQIEQGQTDGIIGYSDKTTFEQIKKAGKANTYVFDSMQTPILFLNPQSPSFAEQNVRKQLLSGIDFDSLVNKSVGELGTVSEGVFPASLLNSPDNEQGEAYNADALKELASGALAGKTLTIAYPSSGSDAKNLCDNIAAQLNAAGVTAKSVGYGQGTYYSVLDKGAEAPDLTVFTGFPDAAHPDCWGRVFYIPDGGLDLFGAQADGVQELLDQAMSLSGGDQATAIYGQVAQRIADAGYWHSISQTKGTAIFGKQVDGVKGSNVPVITGVLDIARLKPAV
jgi:peptide/nickel transport system substrate-binding protein